MKHQLINVDTTKGWIVVRTFPMIYDFLQVWSPDDEPNKGYDAYVSDTPRWSPSASVFPTYEMAAKFAKKFAPKWVEATFAVMPTDREPTVSTDKEPVNIDFAHNDF